MKPHEDMKCHGLRSSVRVNGWWREGWVADFRLTYTVLLFQLGSVRARSVLVRCSVSSPAPVYPVRAAGATRAPHTFPRHLVASQLAAPLPNAELAQADSEAQH